MDTRALRNPYVDYDGSPALTQALFDSSGQVNAHKIRCPFLIYGRGVMACFLIPPANAGVCVSAAHQDQRAALGDGERAEERRPQGLHYVHRLGRWWHRHTPGLKSASGSVTASKCQWRSLNGNIMPGRSGSMCDVTTLCMWFDLPLCLPETWLLYSYLII